MVDEHFLFPVERLRRSGVIFRQIGVFLFPGKRIELFIDFRPDVCIEPADKENRLRADHDRRRPDCTKASALVFEVFQTSPFGFQRASVVANRLHFPDVEQRLSVRALGFIVPAENKQSCYIVIGNANRARRLRANDAVLNVVRNAVQFNPFLVIQSKQFPAGEDVGNLPNRAAAAH